LRSSRKLLEYCALIITLSNLAFLAFYVHAVYVFRRQILPEPFFWMFTVTFSVSIMLLWAFSRYEKIVLVGILTSAFVIVSLPFLRFYFYGTDLVGEHFVADVTYELGRWTPERVTGSSIWLDWHFFQKPDELLHRYFSTTSVTILPATISEVTSLPIRLVLWILLSLVSTVAVIVVFLITRMCFGQKIATLSSIVFVFSSFYLGKFATILREDLALLFLLLAALCILKGGKKSLVVSLISLTLIPMSHYGLVYFAVFFLFLLLISKKVYENKILTNILGKLSPNLARARADDFSENMLISGKLVLYSIVVSTIWLMFVAYPIFVHNLGGFGGSLLALLGLSPTHLSYFQRHVIFSSLGPFHTAIQWLERTMAIVGFVLALRICKSRKAFSLVFAGAGLLAVALALGFLPTLSLYFDLDRTIQVALLGFSVFIAIAVSLLSRKKKFGKGFSVFFVTLMLLNTIQLPILYSSAANLSRNEYVFSFTRVFNFYESSDFQFAKWTERFNNKSAVFVSDSRGYSLCLIAKRICVEPRGTNVSDTISLLESGKTDYFLVLSYLPDYMSFTSEEGFELQFNSTEIAKLVGSNHLNRIYDNSRVISFDYVELTA
jgi:hypothetical protein